MRTSFHSPEVESFCSQRPRPRHKALDSCAICSQPDGPALIHSLTCILQDNLQVAFSTFNLPQCFLLPGPLPHLGTTTEAIISDIFNRRFSGDVCPCLPPVPPLADRDLSPELTSVEQDFALQLAM